MIYLVCQNSELVWIAGETVEAAVENLSKIDGCDYEYFEVDEHDRKNGVEADRRWYFAIYQTEGEYTADYADELAEDGQFLGYIALVERLKG